MRNYQTLVSPETRLAVDGRKVYSRLLLEYFNNIKHLFSSKETDLIKGRLRQGDLSVAQDDFVTLRLEDAKRTGNLPREDFRQLYQFVSLFKKLPEDGDEDRCRQAAYDKLLKGEEDCRNVNRTILARKGFDFPLFDRVSRIIEEILGPVPNDFLDKDVFFGPGSTVNVNGRTFEETSMFYKITDRLVVPERAVNYLAAHLSYNPNWVDMLGTHYHTQQNADESRLSFELRVFRKHFEVVDDDFPSSISFVPKNKEEHRTIGVEMNGLVPLQKVVGDMIRKRLQRKTKVNLDSQYRNRHLARLAQTFELATIDLANASSSISLELVRALLPVEWFVLIEAFRSTHGQCRQLGLDPIKYEMVSSMGNGFTFELESLIFYALAVAIAEKNGMHPTEIRRSIAVFGDDIIVPRRIASDLFTGMSLFGFTPNIEKSFTKGFFFESCGADYYDCTDVRPFFLKRQLTTIKDVLFFMNSILFKAVSQERDDYVQLYVALFKLVPDSFPVGPLHFDSKEANCIGVDKIDDLESVLRVPLSYAQSHGGVVFDPTLYAWRYKKWVRLGVCSSLSLSPQYAVQHARYMTFLKGTYNGKVVLRGQTKSVQKTGFSSQWDGNLTVQQFRLVEHIYDAIDVR